MSQSFQELRHFKGLQLLEGLREKRYNSKTLKIDTHDISSHMVSQENKRQRAVALRLAGISVKDVCDIVQASPRSIKRWYSREKQGQDLSDLPRSGRPLVITPKISRSIVKQIRGKFDVSLRDVAKNIKQKHRISLGLATIKKHLQKLGLQYYSHRPKLKLTPSQMKKRVAFAKSYLNMSWNIVIFSDEKDWNLSHSGKIGLWKFPTDPYPEREPTRNIPPIKTWAAISSRGKSRLIEYTGTLDASDYQELLTKGLLPLIQKDFRRGGYLFQHDNAPPHRAHSTTTWLQTHGVNSIPVGDWPPYSADLNPIENLWGKLQKEMDKMNITSREKYKKILRKKWNDLDKSIVTSLIDSMPNRLRDIIKLKGRALDY